VALFRFKFREVALLLFALLAPSVEAQLKASAAIAISARIPGYIRVTENDMPFLVEVQDGTSSVIDLPVEVTWNLNPRESQAFRLVASFRGTGLIQIATGSIVSADVVKTRVGQNEFRGFADGHSVVLYVQQVMTSNRRGKERKILQLKIDSPKGLWLDDGKYYGLMHLEAESL
jgi:hypothetical protein